MMGAARVRRISTSRPGRSLAWTKKGTASVRAYLTEPHEPWPCVSTRSGELTVLLDGEIVIGVGPTQQEIRLRPGDVCAMPARMPHVVRIERPSRFVVFDRPVREPAPDEVRSIAARALPAKLARAVERAW